MSAMTGDTALEPRYQAGHIFFVDSVAALADAQQGRAPQGEFAALADLLTRQFAGAAAARIRRANFLDLAAQALESCRRRLDEAMPAIENLRTAIDQQRGELSSALAGQIRGELLSARRPWENRLLGQVTSRWGFSPFSLVLRLYQGIGGLASGALLYRARTPAQLALWGVVEGARTWQKHRRNRQLQQQPGEMAAGGFDATQLRRAAVVLEGYAAEAGMPKASASVATLEAEADAASLNFAARLSQDLDALIARQAQRHTGWFTRWRYEILLLAMLGFLLFRLGKNFFYDSWWLARRRRCGAWSRISPRPSGSCCGVSCCSGFSRGACGAGSSRPSTAWPRTGPGPRPLPASSRSWRRLPPGRRVPAGPGVAARRRGTVAGKRVRVG